jgi:hypothetical protein
LRVLVSQSRSEIQRVNHSNASRTTRSGTE